MDDNQLPVRVVKIGGSLLDFPRLRQNLASWIDAQYPMRSLWVVGGGQPVEELRREDEFSDLDALDVHYRCMDLMESNSNRIADQFPLWQSTDNPKDVDQRMSPINLLLYPSNWVRKHGRHLPPTWEVTSDSIAAAIANELEATELVLLKSCDAPTDANLTTLIDDGYLDRYFLKALNRKMVRRHDLINQDWSTGHPPIESKNATTRVQRGMLVRFVNLRSPTFAQTIWFAE